MSVDGSKPLNKDELIQLLIHWCNQKTDREERCFLETHLELLVFARDSVLVHHTEHSIVDPESRQVLQDHLGLLRDVCAKGGTIDAIREIYVDRCNGFVLDLPIWLETIEQLTTPSQTGGNRTKIFENQMREAIVRVKQDTHIAPEILAELWSRLGTLLWNILKDHTQSYQEIIEAYQQALHIYTLARYPQQYASLQRYLGNIYYEWIEGGQRIHLNLAIACHEEALHVYTFEKSPTKWGAIHYNLGNIYQKQVAGKQLANSTAAITHFQAALHVFTYDHFPQQWAMIQHNLGVVYQNYDKGERRVNLEHAIACYNSSLQIHTIEAFPVEWAMTQYCLGNIYRKRIEGERRVNLEQSISFYIAALQVRTYNEHPLEWASTQFNLGVAYRERVEGEHRTNLEQTIACYTATLKVYTQEAYPEDWAQTYYNLGNAYTDRVEGERRTNLERAITYYEASLQVRTQHVHPEDWAQTQRALGNAYTERLEGNKKANLERAIFCYKAALEVQMYKALPKEWSITQHHLGTVFLSRIEGERKENLESAIECYEAALQICTRNSEPENWAAIQHDLGTAYLERFAGDRKENLEQAITCYHASLEVHTYNAFPRQWALTRLHLGMAYFSRLEGKSEENLEHALAYYQDALHVYNCDAFPREYRITQLNKVVAEAKRQNWKAVHEACEAALVAEDILIRMGGGVMGRNAILKEGDDAGSYNGFALARLKQPGKAAVAIERERARGLTEALLLDATNSLQIGDLERRTRYEEARRAFIFAQVVLNNPLPSNLPEHEQRQIILDRSTAYHETMEQFQTLVNEIRAAEDLPDFLENAVNEEIILRAARRGGVGHALVYLVATHWGGIAVLAKCTPISSDKPEKFATLELPELTVSFVHDLCETKLGYTQRMIGGYTHAQEGSGWAWIKKQSEGKNFCQSVETLQHACITTGQFSTLNTAAQKILALPDLAHLIDKSYDQLDTIDEIQLANTLGHYFLCIELQRCLNALAEVALKPLFTWLCEHEVRSLTIIPCGELSVFPLANAPLNEKTTFGDVIPTSIAINAQSLLRSDENTTRRAGVYTIGDPHPTHQALQWGEAEAHTIAKIARNLGWYGEAKVHKKAQLPWFIHALQTGHIVDASCHGIFDAKNFLQSSLRLAGGKRLTLADALSHKVDLRGLRLLILSACQTAILDLRGARDEVYSLAAGMIQAGAQAVLASLWSVDDKASYLLMVRFVQEWLPQWEQEPPVAALVRAQRWLRTVTHYELQAWYATSLPLIAIEERRKAGSAKPEYDPSQEEEKVWANTPKLIAVRGHGYRYEIDEAIHLVRAEAREQINPDACPYADPIYWAAFQMIGW